MRTSTAYFAGAGTVVAAIVAGLGGGLLIANIVSPHSSKHDAEMTRLEQRMSTQPISVIAAPSEPVPYLAATQAAAMIPVAVAPAAQARPEQGQQTDAADNEAANNNNASPPAPSAEANAAREQTASPQDAAAKSRDADTKRAVLEKRRYDGRQRWTEKRRYQQRQDQELHDVEQKVREQTEPTQAFAAERVKLEMPRIRMFESE